MPTPPVNAIDSSERFQAAIEAISKRAPVPKDEWLRLTTLERESAFTVSRVTEADVLQQVLDAVKSAVENGTDLEQFKDDVYAQLLESWGGERPGMLETIFRTNLMTSYNEGRHAIISSPTVRQARPYWRFDAAMDDRTTDECAELDGTVLPADDPFWSTHTPPLHFQAVPASAGVLTARGTVTAANVMAGDMVLTHRGRWRAVSQVLHKLVEGSRLRRLHLDTGRVLRVSHEHPILIQAPTGERVWRHAGNLKIGDHLLEHSDQLPRLEGARAGDADDLPAGVGKGAVANQVVRVSGSARMVLPIDLDADLLFDKSEIDHIAPDGKLRDRSLSEDREQVLLRWSEALSSTLGPRDVAAEDNIVHPHRVLLLHPKRRVGASNPPSPVVLSASLGNDIWRPVGYPNLGILGPDGDPVAFAPCGERCLAEEKIALDCPQTLSTLPVKVGNEGSYGAPVGEVQWHCSTVAFIADEPYRGHLVDLTVNDDESYVADGVVMHNCRSVLVPLSAEEAGEEGIDDEAPDVEADEDFGEAPSKDGENWDFSLERFDPELREMLEAELG